MQVPNIPKLRVPGLYTPGLRALEVPLPVMGNREFSMPRVFTDPVLNMRVRQYYENETNNILTQLGGRVAGAGVGAGTGALLGSTIGAIVGLISTIAGAVSPVPGDEVAGASLLTSSMASFSAAGSKIGAGVGAVTGAVVSDYTTYHAMNDLIKNTMAMVKENPGAGALNALYTVGKSMDIMSGGEAIRASIYSLVNGENALENIAKAYGLTYEGRRDFDTETIRKSLGVDLGRFGNFVIDLFGDLVTDPGFVGAIGAMKLSSKAGKNLFEEALNQAVEEADAINKLFTEAIDNPRMKKHLYKALLEKDYSTIITEVAKRRGSTELTAKAVRKFVDTVNDASRKYVSNNLYNLFKNVDNVDDIVTGYLFKTALPPLGGLSLAKKGYKLVRKYVGITDGTSLGKLNYLVFGNAAKYNFEDYLDQDLEKMYNSEVAKWVRMQYGETTPDTSKVIMKIDGTDYTVNQLYRDVDKLKELQEKEVLLKDEDILLKQQIELRLATVKDFLNGELNKLTKEINNLDPTKVVDIKIVDDNFDGILDLYRNYAYNKWVLDVLNDHGNVTFLRRIMRNIQRMYAFTVTNKTTQVVIDGKNKTKKVFKSLEDVGLRKQFDSQVDELIKLVNDHPELLDTLSAGYYARFIKYIADSIDDGVKKSISDLFKASSESFEQGRKALDKKYDILKNKSEKIIDKINNVDVAYHKYEKRTKPETPKTKEEYLQSKIASLEKLNKFIDKMNKELNVLKQNTRYNVNYFLYRHLVDSKFVSDISGKFNPFKAADGKKEYVKLLDAFHNVINTLNNLDALNDEAQNIIDQIITPYTNYLLDSSMDKEVAAVFRTDTNIHKIFNNNFDYNALHTHNFGIDDSLDMLGILRVITDNKKLYIKDQLEIHKGTSKAEDFINWDKAISGFQKTLETRSIDRWMNAVAIGMGNKDLAERIYTVMLNRTQYNAASFINYAKDLMASKTNPALIVYIDYYIDTFKHHIDRLDKLKGGSITNRDKLKDLVALLEANRTVLVNKGYNDDLFNILKNEIRTLDNYFTTDNMIRNIEDFSKSQIDLKKRVLENKRQEYIDKTNKEKAAVEFKKYLGLKADPFVERYTSQIAELDKQIAELDEDTTILNNNVFELKLQLDKVMKDSPTMFISKNADDYAFDFAVDSLTLNSKKFAEDNGYRFSKSVSANTLGVLHQMAPFDLFARRLLNYIEPVLKNLDYSDLDKVRESLELINTMASRMQLFRESHKAMDELGILSTFHIDKDKLIVKLKDGTDITDYFQAPVYKYSPVKIEVDRKGDKLDVPYTSHQWTTKMQPNYSFDSFRFKQYLLDNKIDLEVNNIDLNKFPAVNDILNSKYLLPVEDIFQTTINGRDIIFSPNNSVVFNRKATAKNPTRFIYIDIEASNGNEHIGEALIQQLHMIEVDINGNVIKEQSFFIDPEEFEELTTKGRFTKSEDAIAVNGIDSIRLQQEFKNGRTRKLAQMKDEFEKFGCSADDAVVIAHNGGGYDFGVLINNFYNDSKNAQEIFNKDGSFKKEMSDLLNINCIDSLQMSMSLFNRGQRMINVELAKEHGLDVKIIKGAPDATNVKDTDELVEYIYDGKVEYYFKGKPLHDAEADTRLTSVWNISQIQELQKIMPSDVSFYDFVSDPTFATFGKVNQVAKFDYDYLENMTPKTTRMAMETSEFPIDVVTEYDVEEYIINEIEKVYNGQSFDTEEDLLYYIDQLQYEGNFQNDFTIIETIATENNPHKFLLVPNDSISYNKFFNTLEEAQQYLNELNIKGVGQDYIIHKQRNITGSIFLQTEDKFIFETTYVDSNGNKKVFTSDYLTEEQYNRGNDIYLKNNNSTVENVVVKNKKSFTKYTRNLQDSADTYVVKYKYDNGNIKKTFATKQEAEKYLSTLPADKFEIKKQVTKQTKTDTNFIKAKGAKQLAKELKKVYKDDKASYLKALNKLTKIKNYRYMMFKQIFGSLFYDGNISFKTTYEEMLKGITYKDVINTVVDLEDEVFVDDLISRMLSTNFEVDTHWSELNKESEMYKLLYGYIQDIKTYLQSIESDYTNYVNTVVNFMNKNTNIGFQQINQVYVRTILNNMILTDTDFNMFRNILSGNSDAFTKGDNYWMLAEAVKNTDSEQLAIAKQYFNDLYDSAMWYNSAIQRYGTNNIDAVHQLMNSAALAMKDFDDIDDFREYLNEILTDKLGRMKSVEHSPVTLGEAEVQEIIERVCSKFDQPEYPLTISGDLTNKMYKYIKEEILDKIATAEDIGIKLDNNTQGVNDLYSLFNSSFQNMLGSFRSVLADVKKENRLHRLAPIDLNNFSQANGVRPYDLPLYNSKYTIKYSYAKRQDSKVSQAMQPIFEGCYKNTNNPSKMVLNFGNTSRGDTIKKIADLLEMDTLEMLNLSKFVKNLDDNAAYDMIWEDMLLDTADPDYLKFAKVQALLNAITEDNASYIADLTLYKKRIRNVFLSNYLEKEKLFNNFEIDNTKSFDRWKRKNKKFYDTVKDTFNAEDFITRVGKSDTSRTARLNNIKTNIKAVQDSNDIFQNIKSMFNGDAKEFSKFFRDRKDLVLVYLDDKFQIKLMDTDNISNVGAILASNQTNKFAIMSRDIYWQVVNKTQPIVLPKWLESMHKYWILPTKLFSLYFSMPYMIKNVTSAYLQNVTANGHRPIKAIQTLLETAKSYHQWKELFNLITSDNKTIYNLLGDFDDVNMHWIDLISSPKKKDIFIKKLNEELADKSGKEAIKIQRLLEILNGLTDADLRMIKEMSEFANTNATFGELTDLQRNININRSKTEELDRLRAKDKLNDDEKHHLWLHNNRPNGEFGTTWQDELNELNAKQNKVSDDYYRMNIIKQYMHDDGYVKHMNNVQKYTGMKSWMDFNSDIEAIFRISMVKEQIEMGADLSQATQKVMDTQFIYNDKSLGMKLLEIIFPFASYPMKAANLFLDLAGDSSFVKTMYLWNKYSWGDEEDAATTSSYLQNRKAQGDVPIGNRLLHLGNAFTESLTALSNPLGAMNDKLTPLLKLPVDALTNAEYSRAPQLAGQLYNPVRAIEDMQKTGQFHAGALFNTSQAYYNYQSNYDKGYYRNYPQRSYLYKNMYTSGGYSRVAMNMQQTTLNNLQYRVGSILYNARYRHR